MDGALAPDYTGIRPKLFPAGGPATDFLIEGEAERMLRPGDFLFLAAHRRHRVTWTVSGEPTVWLAVHFGEGV